MTLERTVVVPGMIDEYDAFADLLGSISAEEWATSSRCAGWTVGDVAGHVVGQLVDVTNLRLDGLGTPEVTERQVRERRGHSPSDLAGELGSATKTTSDLVAVFDDDAWGAPGPQGNGSTLGFGLESLWFDTFLHADDIRASIGRPPVTGSGLAPSVSHLSQVLTEQGWGPATITLDGLQSFPVSGGGDPVIAGDPMAFILVASGRTDPAALGLDSHVNIYR